MLLTKEVLVSINSVTKSYYSALDYEIPTRKDKWGVFGTPRGTKISVRIEDLQKGSHEKVEYLCDYCLENGIETLITTKYNNYNHSRKIIEKDCCFGCKNLKIADSNNVIYGCDNVFQLEENKQKTKLTLLKKYNVEYISQSQEIKDKVIVTNLERYGGRANPIVTRDKTKGIRNNK